MKREKCIYCKKVDIPAHKVIHDNWDRLCEWCILEFEGYKMPIITRVERSNR